MILPIQNLASQFDFKPPVAPRIMRQLAAVDRNLKVLEVVNHFGCLLGQTYGSLPFLLCKEEASYD